MQGYYSRAGERCDEGGILNVCLNDILNVGNSM